MSLLQNPIHVVDQIEWYLDNGEQEKFPGSFLLAAGNLSRQLLEQVLFILAFYGGVPRNRYMKPGHRLKMAKDVQDALGATDSASGLTYLENARLRGPRIAKFAKLHRSFNRWRDLFNEPSHFRNPAAKRRTREHHISGFATRMKTVLDARDCHLIVAAINEIRSKGRFTAILGNDEACSPGIHCDSIVTPSNIVLQNGQLTLAAPVSTFRVVPDDHEIPHRWPKVAES